MLIKIRRTLYWLTDKILGSNRRKYYNNIKFILSNNNTKEATLLKKHYLNNILKHSISTVPYYQSLKIAPLLMQFPVVDKNIIRNNFVDFQSDNFTDKEKRSVSTSGSTGTPFKVYHDKNKQLRYAADNLVFWEKAGYKLGQKIYYFRFWDAFQKKGLITRFLQNLTPIDVFHLSNTYIEKLLADVKVASIHSKINWLGYPSAFDKICDYLDEYDPNFKSAPLNAIVTLSENLNENTKASMKKYFGTETLSRYSNVENGIIAQQPFGASHFIINEASFCVEILEEIHNQPVPHGTIGRIVITDLFNYCMPMIRYDTGDLGTMVNINDRTVLKSVSGRKIDLIKNTKGDYITFNVVLIVNKYPQLKQCQLVQKAPKQYLLRLNAKENFVREKELINEFCSYLGDDAIMSIEYVKDIPILASGKRRVMINEMVAQ